MFFIWKKKRKEKIVTNSKNQIKLLRAIFFGKVIHFKLKNKTLMIIDPRITNLGLLCFGKFIVQFRIRSEKGNAVTPISV
jgi:hypothetical protein